MNEYVYKQCPIPITIRLEMVTAMKIRIRKVEVLLFCERFEKKPQSFLHVISILIKISNLNPLRSDCIQVYVYI